MANEFLTYLDEAILDTKDKSLSDIIVSVKQDYLTYLQSLKCSSCRWFIAQPPAMLCFRLAMPGFELKENPDEFYCKHFERKPTTYTIKGYEHTDSFRDTIIDENVARQVLWEKKD